MARLAADPENRRWQEYMAPIMGQGMSTDGSLAIWEEIFHLD